MGGNAERRIPGQNPGADCVADRWFSSSADRVPQRLPLSRPSLLIVFKVFPEDRVPQRLPLSRPSLLIVFKVFPEDRVPQRLPLSRPSVLIVEVFKALPQDRVQQRSVEQQLASRMSAIMKFDACAGEDPFAKAKGLITELIRRSQGETSSGTSKSMEEDLEADTGKHSFTLETAVSRSTKADLESANEGHPDQICDQISDVVLDACLTCNTRCNVACETCMKDNMIMVAGEITVDGKLHHETVVRGVAQDIGIDSFIDDSSRVDNEGLHYQDCEVLFHVNTQRADIAEGLHVDRDDLHAGNGDLWWSCSDGETQVTDVPVVTRTAAAAQHRSTQQHNHHKQEQWTEQAMQEGARDQREGEKGQEERERSERGKKEKGRKAEKERGKEIKKNVTGWTVVTRSRKRTVQIFVKVDGMNYGAEGGVARRQSPEDSEYCEWK